MEFDIESKWPWIALIIVFILATFVLPSAKCVFYSSTYRMETEWLSFFRYILMGGCHN